MHAILWDSESCDWNKDEYDERNALCLRNTACGFWSDWHIADVPNEPIPMYDHSWPLRHSVHLLYDNDRVKRNDKTIIGGW